MKTNIEKIDFCTLPTPLYRIDGILEDNELYIKRDDLTGLACGGNKTRKVEFFIKDALDKGSDHIVTYGSAQSNLCTAVAASSSRINLPCTLIVADTEEVSVRGNMFLYNLYGAKIIFSKISEVKDTISITMKDLKKSGHNPYFIEGGGHGNLGTYSYMKAYEEIMNQALELNISFDYIFHASGTGTTQAGLIAGKIISDGTEEIIGISIARKKERGIKVIEDSLSGFFADNFKSHQVSEVKKQIHFNDSYIGKSYGDAYEKVVETIKYVAQKTGILLDPTYTGKAFYGMTDYISKNDLSGKRILFIHTGGIPILFSNSEKLGIFNTNA